MLFCPNCGKTGISGFRALFLGPSVPAIWKECREKVAPSYGAIVISLPFVAASIFVEYFIESSRLAFIIGTSAALVSYSILELFPLKSKHNNDFQNKALNSDG